MSLPLRRQERLSEQPSRSYLPKDLCGRNGIIAIHAQLMAGSNFPGLPRFNLPQMIRQLIGAPGDRPGVDGEVRYGEGVAIHTGPEPCVGPRGSGRSVGRGACRPAIEPRKATVPGADVVTVTEGHTSGGVSASLRRSGVVRDPGMHGRSLPGTGRSPARPQGLGPLVRIGKVRSRSR